MIPTEPNDDIVKADPVYRKRLFGLYLLCTVLGAALLGVGVPAVLRFVRTTDLGTAFVVVELVFWLVFAAFLPPAVYVIYFGRRVLREGRIPWEGQKVIRDTKIKRGRQAICRGRALVVLGTTLIVLDIMSAAATHYLFFRLRTDPFSFIRW